LLKNNSNGSAFQYDFIPPRNWDIERIDAEQKKIVEILKGLERGVPPKDKLKWIDLASLMPGELRRVLILELNAGNKLAGIGSSDWPHQGSIVVNVRDCFNVVSHSASPEVHWRNMNDAHYCREELSQTFKGIVHLIIA
jgi:hypothetical protein